MRGARDALAKELAERCAKDPSRTSSEYRRGIIPIVARAGQFPGTFMYVIDQYGDLRSYDIDEDKLDLADKTFTQLLSVYVDPIVVAAMSEGEGNDGSRRTFRAEAKQCRCLLSVPGPVAELLATAPVLSIVGYELTDSAPQISAWRARFPPSPAWPRPP